MDTRVAMVGTLSCNDLGGVSGCGGGVKPTVDVHGRARRWWLDLDLGVSCTASPVLFTAWLCQI
jgi:hypothetical protein